MLPVVYMRIEAEENMGGKKGVRSGELERRARGFKGRVHVRG